MIDIKVARQTLHELKVKGREKLDAIKAEDRLPSEEEEAELATIESEVEAAAQVVSRVEAQMDRERAFVIGDISGGTPATDEIGNPFKSLGDQLQAVATTYQTGKTDPRLLVPDLQGAPQGLGSHQGGEGGFLVRSEFSSDLFTKAHQAATLLNRVDKIPIGPDADGLEVPYVDETSRASGSRWGGVSVSRVNEGDAATASRPKFGLMETRLIDIMGLAYVTERLLKDSTALGAVLSSSFTEEFGFVVDDEIYNGTGSGQMLGILNSNALVTVSKETGQLANTIVVENIVKMWSRMHAASRANSIWLINQDIEPQLFTLGVTVGTGGVPVYLPANGLSASPFASIMGRPVVPIEHCPTLGTKGDIALVDLSQYFVIEKGGVDAAESMHVRFTTNERAFRWVVRNNGQPKWKTTLTPAKGSNTQSPFVTLATRS